MSGFEQQTTLASPTGATLNLFHQGPKKPVRGIVQINHGLAERAARYAAFANHLSEQGLAVFVHDHRGHGETKAPDAPIGIFARAPAGRAYETVLADTLAVNDHARSLYPDMPVITFGHSMGGLIAMNFALTHPDKQAAVAVWNSNFKMGFEGRFAQLILATERMMLGSDVPSRILPKLTFAAWGKSVAEAETEFDWLSHDREKVAAYIDDPLCGWDASVSLWQDIFAMAFRGGNTAALSDLPRALPIHLVGGGQDPATANGKAVSWMAERLRAQGFENVTLNLYDGLRHETLNESAPPGAKGAMDDFCAWANGVISRA
ncbi:MAG: alpha/beta hydrolase [Pseudomonadota bacterium]